MRYEKRATGAQFGYIDYGALALRRSVIAERPADLAFGLDEVQSALAHAGMLRAHSVSERFYEIGSELGIRDLEAKLSER